MAENYDKTNRGYLSRNDRKQPGSKHPDFGGVLNVNGVDCELAAWIREKDDRKYFSLKLTFPDTPSNGASPSHADDDIPF